MATCTNFSASKNVAAVTSGPTPFAVPNADGEPGGSFVECAADSVAPFAILVPALTNAADETRNCRRDVLIAYPQLNYLR